MRGYWAPPPWLRLACIHAVTYSGDTLNPEPRHVQHKSSRCDIVANMTADRTTEMLPTREAAALMGLTRSALAQLVRRGQIRPDYSKTGPVRSRHYFHPDTIAAELDRRAKIAALIAERRAA